MKSILTLLTAPPLTPLAAIAQEPPRRKRAGRRTVNSRFLAVLLCVGLATLRLEGAEILDPAVTVSRIDLAATQAIRGNGVETITPTTLSDLLDSNGAGGQWKAAAPADAKAGPFHHRLAFKQAVELGAFLAEVDGGLSHSGPGGDNGHDAKTTGNAREIRSGKGRVCELGLRDCPEPWKYRQ